MYTENILKMSKFLEKCKMRIRKISQVIYYTAINYISRYQLQSDILYTDKACNSRGWNAASDLYRIKRKIEISMSNINQSRKWD